MKYSGIVLRGAHEARELGSPTLNIAFKEPDVSGIYAARVETDGTSYAGVAYVNTKRGILETHLFDFSEDLYGKEISVELIEKLREDAEFEDAHAQKSAIASDIRSAREYFRRL